MRRPSPLLLLCALFACKGAGKDGLDSDPIGPDGPLPSGVDTSFADGGILRAPVSVSTDTAFASVRTADGGLVVVGCTGGVSHRGQGLVSRFDASGVLDTGFGTGGHTSLIRNDVLRYDGVAELGDGSLLVSGTSFSGASGSQAWLVRYTADGALDTGWGDDGAVSWPSIGTGRCHLEAEPSGRAWVLCPGDFEPTIRAIAADGSLDTSFGDAGLAELSGDEAVALGRLADGRLLALVEESTESYLHTLDASGSLLGTQVLEMTARALAVEPGTGRVAVAGEEGGPVVAVLLASGGLDASFGTDGWGTVATATFSEGVDVAWAPDGGLVVGVGQTGGYGTFYGGIRRLAADGTEMAMDDAPFRTVFQGGNFGTVRVDGDVVEVVGSARVQDPGAEFDERELAVARIGLDGTPAPFGTAGVVRARSGRSSEMIWDLERGTDGRLVALGAARVDALWLALDEDGLIGAWGNGGQVVSNNINYPPLYLDGQGRMVARAVSGWPMRWTPDAEPDAALGQNGVPPVLVDGSLGIQSFRGLFLDDAERFVVGGVTAGNVLRVARLDADGAVDAGFGTAGAVDLPLATQSQWIEQVGASGDGGYVVVGGTLADGFIARMDGAGVLDPGFGTDGVAVYSPQFGAFEVLPRPGGGYLILGIDRVCPFEVCGLQILAVDDAGAVDPDFGVEGLAVLTEAPGWWADVDVRDDGVILVAGGEEVDDFERFTVWALSPEGALLPGFGTGGRIQLPTSGGAATLLRDGDGWLVGGWMTTEDGGTDPVVVRIDG